MFTTEEEFLVAGGAEQASRRVRDLITPAVTAAGFDLEDVAVTRAGSRSVVRVVVDRDGGVDLDAVAVASRAVSDVMDANEDAVAGVYVLEVTSPGVDRPLTLPRHWRRAIGRLVAVSKADGSAVTGRVTAAGDDSATLDVGEVEYAEVRRAVVQVEFSRPGVPEPADVLTDDDLTDDDLTDDDPTDDDPTDDDLSVSDDDDNEEDA